MQFEFQFRLFNELVISPVLFNFYSNGGNKWTLE